MLFKLSLKNMKKSFKDYAIYFLTLVLGVAIFYMFNSLDSQEAMLQVSNSTREMIKLMINMLRIVSIFVAVVLGLLIVYANNFLINRRKKEFGIYMTLGMGKRQISKIIVLETIFIGIISLVVGLILGIFASQFMSVLVTKLFEADMTNFTFVFSNSACIQTCICFAVMYVAVMIFNTITISRYKLIDLLTAIKKNEEIKVKNPIISIVIFIIASIILGYAYYKVTLGVTTLDTMDKVLPIILMGIISTVLIFWSLSGFILKIIQARKKIYLKDTNMFVLRQMNNKINTTVISMSVICLMLFMTISVLSSALSLRNTMQKDLVEMTPVDVNIYKTANLPDTYTTKSGKVVSYKKEQIESSKTTVEQTLKEQGFDMNLLKDVVEIPIYETNEIALKDTLGKEYEQIRRNFPMIQYESKESIVKVSDYNKIAKLYGIEQYQLEDNEYIILCDYDNMRELRNRALENSKNTLKIAGKEYHAKYKECKAGFVVMATSHMNTGIILVPDSCKLTNEMKQQTFFAANYRAETSKEKEEIEKILINRESGIVQDLLKQGIKIDGVSKIYIMESSVGLAIIITFIAIYLGVIFLIASSAILALKQLTESSDNKQRYMILRKIGADEKMINRALFRQIGIFFAMPMILAIIHSIFGIQFVLSMMAGLASTKDLLPSVITTTIIIGIIYGLYFLATYIGSKNIIKEE